MTHFHLNTGWLVDEKIRSYLLSLIPRSFSVSKLLRIFLSTSNSSRLLRCKCQRPISFSFELRSTRLNSARFQTLFVLRNTGIIFMQKYSIEHLEDWRMKLPKSFLEILGPCVLLLQQCRCRILTEKNKTGAPLSVYTSISSCTF